MNDDAIDERRVCWHSRRGMLELDLVLMPFAEQVYPGLDNADKLRYRTLLECEDADLFSWIVHREPVSAPELVYIIGLVLDHGRARIEYPHQGV